MEWITSLKSAISFMENNLERDITINDIASSVYMSPMYLQKGFQILTGYSIGEYLRNRRLYLAALDLIATDSKIIDIAFKYCYQTSESFTKAFSRFHGAAPSQVRKDRNMIKPFLPLKISIVVQGGDNMDYIVEKMESFKVIGYEREFSFDTAYNEIPKFWNEILNNRIEPLMKKEEVDSAEKKIIKECRICEFGVCIDNVGEGGKFNYLIAGIYKGGEVPKNMKVFEFPEMEWVKIKCVGPMPASLQSVNTKVFQEWLPGNKEFEIAMGVNIEWYSEGNSSSANYESGIWIPVKRK